MINTRAIINVLFALMIFLGVSLLVPAVVAWIYHGPELADFLKTGIGCIVIGGA